MGPLGKSQHVHGADEACLDGLDGVVPASDTIKLLPRPVVCPEAYIRAEAQTACTPTEGTRLHNEHKLRHMSLFPKPLSGLLCAAS